MTYIQDQFPSPIDQFRNAIAEKGMVPPDTIEQDGKMHRFSSNGRPDDDAGWYVLYAGTIASGAFGDFRTGQAVRSWVADIGRDLLPVEKMDFKQKQEDMRVKREAETAQRRAKAKSKAATIMRISSPAHDGHPYLQRKQVGAYGIRQWNDLLVIPMIDDSGEVQSLQLISADGDKKFLSGGKMQGCYFAIGKPDQADKILIAEGYATAATLHEATGLPVIVAYNAGNLMPVAKVIRSQYPDARIILCADDDIKTKGNPGLTKAREAADAIGGTVIMPDFGDDRPDGATDFNDMAAHRGKVAVSYFFTQQFLQMGQGIMDSIPDNSDDRQDAFLSRPANSNKQAAATDMHSMSPPVLPLRDPVAQSTIHFPADKFEIVDRIWKDVPRQMTLHGESGYHIVTDDKHKIIVTHDHIELPHNPKHRPDAAYAAACEHAHQFWGGRMEVTGDEPHRIKAWAYATVHGIEITNFTPTPDERAKADKIIISLRKVEERSFRRPTPERAAQKVGLVI